MWLVASVIGSINLVSAATVDEFIWISNSQHLIAHMFIALFLVLSDRINLAAMPKSALLVAFFYWPIYEPHIRRGTSMANFTNSLSDS